MRTVTREALELPKIPPFELEIGEHGLIYNGGYEEKREIALCLEWWLDRLPVGIPIGTVFRMQISLGDNNADSD